MSKWTKTRCDPGRTYQHEDETRQLREDVRRVKELIVEAALGNPDAESAYVTIINRLEPGMTKERRKELLKQFADAVYDHQIQHGLRSR